MTGLLAESSSSHIMIMRRFPCGSTMSWKRWRKSGKAEDEANRVKDYLKEVENSRAALQTELQNLHNEVNKNIDPQTDNKANKTNVLR